MNQAPLGKSILRTLAYFDIFSFPLTAEEIFNFLWRPPALGKDDFINGLEILVNQGSVGKKDDYYFLSRREMIVAERLDREKICAKKIKKAERAARILSIVPFLNAIFLCNSVAAGTATEKSDIDFFIVAAPGRLWLVRALANFLLRLTGMRTYGTKLANRVCLSFFTDEKSINFSDLRFVEEDIYFAYWIHQLVPLFDPYGIGRDLINANQWTVRYLPYIRNVKRKSPIIKLGNGKRTWRRIWEKFWFGWYGDLLENQAEGLGRQKMKFSIKEKAKLGDKRIVLGKNIIKLHEGDRRQEIRDEWVGKTQELAAF